MTVPFPNALAYSFLLCVWGVGCVGSHLTPVAQVPMLEHRGQAEVGVAARPFAPQRSLDAAATVAASEHFRMGTNVNGSIMRRSIRDVGLLDGPLVQTKSLLAVYAEGWLGAEGGRQLLRYGGFMGSGYGVSHWTFAPCRGSRGDTFECNPKADKRIMTRYVRAHALGYLGLAPRGPFSLAAGLRLPIDHDLERIGARKRTRLSGEPFMTVSLTSHGGLRTVVQWTYGRDVGLHVHLGLRLRLERARPQAPSDSRPPERFMRF